MPSLSPQQTVLLSGVMPQLWERPALMSTSLRSVSIKEKVMTCESLSGTVGVLGSTLIWIGSPDPMVNGAVMDESFDSAMISMR